MTTDNLILLCSFIGCAMFWAGFRLASTEDKHQIGFLDWVCFFPMVILHILFLCALWATLWKGITAP